MYPFSNALELVLNPDPSILNEKCKDQVHSLGENSRQQLKCKHILETWADEPGLAATYSKLRQELNDCSIFCGRHPLDLVGTNLRVWLLISEQSIVTGYDNVTVLTDFISIIHMILYFYTNISPMKVVMKVLIVFGKMK